ncbi:uncharacterized protein Dwil_GK28196 [Drosophila willistoni]|uniref:Uncharacterized protein n=1 Tax=Drosophila willistoni TaxID=7260 RepID=A0A0Q9WR53_DROWI|nr:uncharacterized protein Dwil_GK28196 [Drosophila willistoni]
MQMNLMKWWAKEGAAPTPASSSNGGEWAPARPPGGGCTTVTMLLAQRIARRNNGWSVDNEPCYSSNKMNVWQTLEYLSSLSLRKRYNYEGFVDTHNVIRTLTPSWRRDSYAEKTKAEEIVGSIKNIGESGSGKYGEGERGANRRSIGGVGVGVADPIQDFHTSVQSSDNLTVALRSGGTKHRTARRRKKREISLDPEYALSPEDLQDLVKCK